MAASSLRIGGDHTVTNAVAATYDPEDSSLVSCLVSLRRGPQFAELAAAWEFLPAAIRTGIVTMVRTTRQHIK